MVPQKWTDGHTNISTYRKHRPRVPMLLKLIIMFYTDILQMIDWDYRFLDVIGCFSLLLKLLLKVTKVTTEHQKLPRMSQNSIVSPFYLAEGHKKSILRRRKHSAGPRSWPVWRALSSSVTTFDNKFGLRESTFNSITPVWLSIVADWSRWQELPQDNIMCRLHIGLL